MRLKYDLLQIHSSIESRMVEEKSSNLIKTAFDTRRTDQEVEINPRRNLQYYHRSQPFISTGSADRIKLLFKLKKVLDGLKEEFLGDYDWLDSYARILSDTLDRTLRIGQKDYDFFTPQFDYLEQLLYMRYRIKLEELENMSEKEIKDSILAKDEKLLHKAVYTHYIPNKKEPLKSGNVNIDPQIKEIQKTGDQLIEQLFGGVKANKDNKEVERQITITIKDKINDISDDKIVKED